MRIEQQATMTQKPTPRFSIKDKKNNKKALYINERFMWELTQEECSKNVLDAIMHAYFTGVHDMHLLSEMIMEQTVIKGDLRCQFEEEG